MKHRKLRIAWSTAWGIVAVSLVGLSVRSYWWKYDLHSYAHGSEFGFFVEYGVLGTVAYHLPTWPHLNLHFSVGPITDSREMPGLAGFYYGSHPADHSYSLLLLPVWFLAVLAAMAGALSWIPQLRWHFTLRTLLIVTTLVAVGLGLMVWSVR